ncbi:MAG TPA: hypothetical protein VLH10_17125, partial [Yinghuangia sp.]|nr:hypothetical protein [Yinghuangia sp.]
MITARQANRHPVGGLITRTGRFMVWLYETINSLGSQEVIHDLSPPGRTFPQRRPNGCSQAPAITRSARIALASSVSFPLWRL